MGGTGMSNLEKYNEVFCEVFSLEQGFEGEMVKMSLVKDWDSVGHVNLIGTLEDAFDIMLDTEDILKLKSYEDGIEILKKYNIEL